MPLVRISLRGGKNADYLRALSEGVHRALVTTFDVPTHDKFQLIEQLEPNALIYDADYLDVSRTDDIVLIHIVASATRNLQAKQALYKAIVQNLSADPGLRPGDVQIVLSSNGREDWSFGNGVASYVPNETVA